MDADEFRKNAHAAVDWVADYLEKIESYPVKSDVKPGEIKSQIPDLPPSKPEDFDALMDDFEKIILPGITHWQHPNFHAYFPANSSYPSIIGEILTAGLGAQCMVWETSPAAAELEEKMMDWLKSSMGLPEHWHGVIQDTASTATLVALITAREKISNYAINREGFGQQKLTVYCSAETHSSIEKAAKIAGFGSENVRKIPVDHVTAMDTSVLENAISEDLAKGLTPCCVVSTLGTTGTLGMDPTREIGEICKKYNVWMHVDAAYAGSAMLLPECEELRDGLELADSYVFNPHKWLFTNFDCSAYFVVDREALLQTFEILPEYLKTATRGVVNDYRDWGIQLGRRFRALKLWFVFRSYGIENMRSVLRQHIEYAQWLEEQILAHPQFELLVPRTLNMVVFRYVPTQKSEEELNQVNEELLQKINASGKAYLSHTKVNGKYGIRLVTGQTRLAQHHVRGVWESVLMVAHETQN